MENTYVLITAAKNEADCIESTIKAVVHQTLQPKKWIIVSDHSTDGTDDIVNKYADEYSFIRLLKFDGAPNRDFASKVHAISAAFDLVKNLDFDFIGIIDADITFDENYYNNIINKFYDSVKLGIAGGGFYDVYDGKKIKIPHSVYSVRGAVQLFRRECYEDIGGIVPLRWGGEDGVACAAARMKGWEIQTFEDIIVYHNRKTGSIGLNIFSHKFVDGKREYNRGLIPLAQFLKCINRITAKPFLIGIVLQLAGYWWFKLKKEEIIIPPELLKHIENEQKIRIRNMIKF